MTTSGGGPVDGVAVVGAVRGDAGRGALALAQQGGRLRRVVRVAVRQHVGRDLAGAGVHAQLQPAPAQPAVLGCAPLALAEQPKARAVQHEVHQVAARLHAWLASGKGACAGWHRTGPPRSGQHGA